MAADHQEADALYKLTPSPDHLAMAKALLGKLTRTSIKLRPNKAVVDYSLPNEVVRILLRPHWVYKSKEKWGLGHATEYCIPPIIQEVLIMLLAKIACTRLVPMIWHLATGFAVPKHNLKPGILGND
jgi:hypothetical protein